VALTLFTLARRSLRYYWQTHLAVVLSVGVAVSVLAGALVVGDSVRGSLRELALGRLGRTAFVIRAPQYVEAAFLDRLVTLPAFASAYEASSLIAVTGVVVHQEHDAHTGGVDVYGVDQRFFTFHGRAVDPPGMHDAYISEALARETNVAAGDTIVVRVETPSVIPAESLYARKDDMARTVRLAVRRVLTAAEIGEFSLDARQGAVRVVFTSLEHLQRALDRKRQVNTILVAETKDDPSAATRDDMAALADLVRRTVVPADVGISVSTLPAAGAVVLEHASGLLGDALAAAGEAAADDLGLDTQPVLSWLANLIRADRRTIQHSMVAALDLEAIAPGASRPPPVRRRASEGIAPNNQSSFDDPPMVLNDWAARQLGARTGDSVWIAYYLWEPEGMLRTEMARFRVAAVVPIRGAADDRRLVPDYPGIAGADHLADWDPPFPLDLGQVRPADEDYWRRYRTTPKAFVPLETGRRLWGSRHGSLTSLRVVGDGRDLDALAEAFRVRLGARLAPEVLGIATYAVRADNLRASEGATDVGESFVCLGLLLVGSSLLLVSLFFRLGIEQRAREIGLLRAAGFPVATVRGLFLREALILSLMGGVVGVVGAVGYAWLVLYGLRTWWIGAIGTTALGLHVGPLSLVLGAVSGVTAAVGVIGLTVRRAVRATPRRLLAGWVSAVPTGGERPRLFTPFLLALVSGIAGCALAFAALAALVPGLAGFGGAGSLLLVASLAYAAFWLRRREHDLLKGHGLGAVCRLGFRSAAYCPGRSVLAIALIASMAFLIVAVNVFRRGDGAADFIREGGTGGFSLMAEVPVAIVYDLSTVTGRDALGFELPADQPFSAARFVSLRFRPGDDASCLNLYRPQNPRILGVGRDLTADDRFGFRWTLAETPDAQVYPWTLLDHELPDGVVPVVADAASMADVLHVRIGDEMTIVDSGGRPVKLRFVAALADSIFQSEVLMSEENFTRLFPERQGYQVFLIDVEPRWAPALAAHLEDGLANVGFDVVSTPARLASFRLVRNTHLSIFQTLSAFGLLLGTIGLATVTLRNGRERCREFAQLRSVGYRTIDLLAMILAESALLLGFGLACGVGAGLVATAPAFLERGMSLSGSALATLLGAVLAGSFLSSLAASVATARRSLLASLRSE
jgi:ABC-type lipoprotein release transport system permease subunit